MTVLKAVKPNDKCDSYGIDIMKRGKKNICVNLILSWMITDTSNVQLKDQRVKIKVINPLLTEHSKNS